MWLQKGLNLFNRISRSLVNLLKNLAICILTAMMLLTAADVFLRYLFNRPITGKLELVEFMMAMVIPFSIVYCAHQKLHVHVDILIEHLSKRSQTILSCITCFLSLVLFILIAWQSFIYIADEYGSKLTSAVLYIPVYPFIAMVAFAFAILSLILLVDFFNRLTEILFKWNHS